MEKKDSEGEMKAQMRPLKSDAAWRLRDFVETKQMPQDDIFTTHAIFMHFTQMT